VTVPLTAEACGTRLTVVAPAQPCALAASGRPRNRTSGTSSAKVSRLRQRLPPYIIPSLLVQVNPAITAVERRDQLRDA
jgi:hypothetical protein